MKNIWMKKEKQPEDLDLESPVLIEGLPGIGLVGKLSVDQIRSQLDTEKYAEIHSTHFQPQADIQEDHTVKLRRNNLHIHKREKGKKDLVLLTGEEQGVTPQGQYLFSEEILEEAKKLGVEEIYTLGGYKANQMKDNPTVFGAITHTDLKDEYEEKGVTFNKKGPIGGAAGLLLGLGVDKGMEGICLMGETHGKFIDPNAAKEVLKIVEDSLGLEIDHSELDEKAEEVKETIEKMKKAQGTQNPQGQSSGVPGPSDPSQDYIQ